MAQAELIGFERHGGRLDEAMRIYPDAPRPWLDLSTGINPNAWSSRQPIAINPGALPAISALATLEAAAARHFEVDPARVAAVPGSEVALRLLGALGLPRPIVARSPGYGTHADAADGIWAGDAPGGTVLLANPNNPDGSSLPPSELHGLAIRQADAGGWLVIDEAFADGGIPPGLEDLPAVTLRSFGKFFGLAGVRLGFVIAPSPIVARVRALLGDWPVGAHAIAWGTAAYSDDAWIAGTRLSLAAEAARLDALLARRGLIATGASPLFRLVEHPQAPAVFQRLARAGILTRPFAYRPDWLRFGLPGDDAGFERLERALSDG